MKKMVLASIVLGIFLAMGITSMAMAERQPADNMQIVREKIQADKKLLIAENMGLTEKQAAAFWPVYASYQKELMQLNNRSIKLIQFYNYAGDFGSAKVSDSHAQKVLEEFLTIEGDRQKLRQSYLPKFTKVIPYAKVLRYYQLERKIEAVISFDLAAKIPLAN